MDIEKSLKNEKEIKGDLFPTDKELADPFIRERNLKEAARILRRTYELANVPEKDIDRIIRDIERGVVHEEGEERRLTRKEVGRVIYLARQAGIEGLQKGKRPKDIK